MVRYLTVGWSIAVNTDESRDSTPRRRGPWLGIAGLNAGAGLERLGRFGLLPPE